MTVNWNGAALLSEETQAAWKALQVCCTSPGGRLTAGDGTPPPVIAVEVEVGTCDTDVPGAGAPGLVPVVRVMLKLSLPEGKVPAELQMMSLSAMCVLLHKCKVCAGFQRAQHKSMLGLRR